MKLLIVEDEGYKKLYPLTLMRPVWEIVCGATSILDKIKRANPGAELEFVDRYTKGKGLNGRKLPSGREITFPWDPIKNLKEDLEEDFKYLKPGIRGQVHSTAVIHNPENVLIEEGAVVDAQAVLDARQGPIYIGKNTIIHPHTLLRGPLSIGHSCKIAGEVLGSIIMPYVNKGHYGFLGHSYVCSWVNLGAGTTNSNLKNNYSNVKVEIEGKPVDSGMQFLGCFIGDHTKTAIGTMIYTGCVIGVGANLFGQPFYKKRVPSFAWGAEGRAKLEETIETARATMKRRNLEISQADTDLLKKVYSLTK